MTITDKDGNTHTAPVILHGNGTVSDFRHKDGDFTLGELQDALGGYFEFVEVNPWSDVVLAVNPSTKSKRCNETASEIAGQYVAGDAVLMERKDLFK